MTEKKPHAASLYERLSRIRAEFGAVKKDGTNTFHHYNYVTESQIMERLSTLCTEHGIFILPNVKSVSKEGDLTTIWVEYIIAGQGIENTLTIAFPGTGQDKGDKGLYKALTGSYKYFVMKTFQIASEDDPENEKALSHEAPLPAPPQRQAQKPLAQVTQQVLGQALTHPFIYKNNAGSKTEFTAVNTALKSAGFKFFGAKEGFDNTWRGTQDMGPNFEKYLVASIKPKTKEQEEIEIDDIPFNI